METLTPSEITGTASQILAQLADLGRKGWELRYIQSFSDDPLGMVWRIERGNITAFIDVKLEAQT